MELRQIRSFVALAERLHFGQTARLLNLSQPALSKQIQLLEEDLGGALLQRGKHGARLTALGRQFLAGAKALVRNADELIEETRRTARGDSGRLRIGFGFHTFEIVPRVVVKLRKKAPAIDITLRDMSTAEQIAALRAERIDVGFLRLPVSAEFASSHVIEDRLMLVSNAAERRPASWGMRDCRDMPFVLISRDRSPNLHRHVMNLCEKNGFHPRVVQEVPEVTTALALVRAGLGLSIIPQSFTTTRFAGVKFHPLPGREARYAVSAAWRKGDENPLIQRFLKLLDSETGVNPELSE